VRDLLASTPLLQMGWIVALSTLAPLVLGVVLDRRLGTTPLFIIIGAVIGILASTIGAVRIATRRIDALGKQPSAVDQAAPERVDDKED
jgi:F0F1-type ATP synthase assembly protein I